MSNADSNLLLGFKIEEFDREQNVIRVRPYSPKFKNPIETYPIFTVSLASLDPNVDVSKQISLLLSQELKNILSKESANQTTIEDKIDSLIGQKITIHLTDAVVPTSTSSTIPSVSFVS